MMNADGIMFALLGIALLIFALDFLRWITRGMRRDQSPFLIVIGLILLCLVFVGTFLNP